MADSPYLSYRSEAASVSAVLYELGFGNDAIELAIAFNLEDEIAYCLSSLIQSANDRLNPECGN